MSHFDDVLDRLRDPSPTNNGSIPARKKTSQENRQEFSNYFEEEIQTADNKEAKIIKKGLSIQRIKDNLDKLTGNWPRSVGDLLFAPGADCTPIWLLDPNALFAWIGDHLPEGRENGLRWTDGTDKVPRTQFYAYLQQKAKRYDAVEAYPHYPELPATFYLHPELEGGDGTALRWLLHRFEPATPIDNDLILAFFLTLFWGGKPGQRPAWLVTADDEGDPLKGRGSGKSTLANVGGYLVNGLIQASAKEEMSKLKTRLLTPGARLWRIVLIDNIKTLKFSWAELEALITGPIISGHQMYAGEGQRPNTLIWCLTVNGASLSRDMAQRTIVIKVKRPTYSAEWEEETRSFIEGNRWKIIGDCLALLRQRSKPLARYSRWAAWEAGVLSRVDDPCECQKVMPSGKRRWMTIPANRRRSERRLWLNWRSENTTRTMRRFGYPRRQRLPLSMPQQASATRRTGLACTWERWQSPN